MCDYSLHANPNRLAREGEQLVVYRFPTGSLGLASPSDVHRHSAPQVAGRSLWEAIRGWASRLKAESDKVCAVCIPPGARLVLRDIPQEVQREFGVSAVEEVKFVQLSASAYTYRDGVRFRHGREVLLQRLPEGLRAAVLSLGPAEEMFERPFEVPARMR